MTRQSEHSRDPVLRMNGVRHAYGDTLALDRAGLRVDAGECVALLGPNGAGKTTLVDLAIGLLVRQHGEIRLAGGDPRAATTRRNLGVVHQALGFPTTLTVRELVAGAAIRGGAPRSAAEPLLAELGLSDCTEQRAVNLSGGQRQRLQLAMALTTDPALLVLDEPTSGMDTAARRWFWQLLAQRRERGTGVLVTTHLIEESAAVADRVVVLDHGRVLADETPETLIARMPDRTVIARTDLDLDRLAALPDVATATRNGEHVRLSSANPENLLRILLATDDALSDLRVESAGLEEAVVSLTAKEPTP